MISESSEARRSSTVLSLFSRWGHFSSRCEMENLQKETIDVKKFKNWLSQITSLSATTFHSILTAGINNQSLHSFPLSSDHVSESLPQQGSMQPLPIDQNWPIKGNSCVILSWLCSTSGISKLLSAPSYSYYSSTYYLPGVMLILFIF